MDRFDLEFANSDEPSAYRGRSGTFQLVYAVLDGGEVVSRHGRISTPFRLTPPE